MTLFTGRNPKDVAYCSALPNLADFSPQLPEPQKQWSCTDLVAQTLNSKSIGSLFPIMGNDRFGCCVVAGACHMITLHSGLGTPPKTSIASSQDVVNQYFALTGGADNGLPLSTMLQKWMKGAFGHQIRANCSVNPSNMKAVKQTIQFLGGAFIGFATTGQTVAEFQNGQPWDVTNSREQGGHCVVLTGFDDEKQELLALTWGGLQRASYAWLERYCDEVHAVISDEITAFDSTTLDVIKAAMPSGLR